MTIYNNLKTILYLSLILYLLIYSIFKVNTYAQHKEENKNNTQFDSISSLDERFSFPGGLMMFELEKHSHRLPSVRFGIKEPVILDLGNRWKVIIGISLDTIPNEYLVFIKNSASVTGGEIFKFNVRNKTYPLTTADNNPNLPGKNYKLSNLSFSNSQAPALPLLYPINDGQEWENKFGYELPTNSNNTDKANTSTNRINYLLFSSMYSQSIVAPQNAIISRVTTNQSGLSTIALDHGRGLYSVISNIENLTVKEGEGVVKGSIIARVPSRENLELINMVTWQTILNSVHVDPSILTAIK